MSRGRLPSVSHFIKRPGTDSNFFSIQTPNILHAPRELSEARYADRVAVVAIFNWKAEHKGAAREIHKASCADCGAVEVVLSDWTPS